MKIMFLGPSNSPHLVRWVSFFANHHQVAIVSQDTPEDSLEGVTYYHLKHGRRVKPLTYWRRIRECKRFIREFQPDITHAHYITTYGHVAARTGFFPIVMSAWGSDVLINPEDSWVMRQKLYQALDGGWVFHVDGVKTREALIQFGISNARIRTIYFGIDHERYHPVRHRNNPPVVISLRNLNPIYNVETFIRARSHVSEPARFVVVGDGSEREKLMQLAKNLNVEVEFTGRVPFETIPELLGNADIYVSTSLSDAGLASSTGEAMACGLPVVVSDDQDNREWVDPDYIFTPGDASELAQLLDELLADPIHRQSVGLANRKRIMSRNDYQVEMRKAEDLYREMVESN